MVTTPSLETSISDSGVQDSMHLFPEIDLKRLKSLELRPYGINLLSISYSRYFHKAILLCSATRHILAVIML